MTNRWQEHLEQTKIKNPNLSLKDCMQKASSTYNKKDSKKYDKKNNAHKYDKKNNEKYPHKYDKNTSENKYVQNSKFKEYNDIEPTLYRGGEKSQKKQVVDKKVEDIHLILEDIIGYTKVLMTFEQELKSNKKTLNSICEKLNKIHDQFTEEESDSSNSSHSSDSSEEESD